MVAAQFNKEVRSELRCRLLREHGSHARVPREKPFSKKNKALRLKYAKEFIDKDNSFCSTALFSDESKFDVFAGDGRKIARRRKKNTELNPKYLWLTVKYGGGSVIVQGCVAASGDWEILFFRWDFR